MGESMERTAGTNPPGTSKPCLDSGRAAYQAVNEQVPCDRLAVGAIHLPHPQPDEFLVVHGWSGKDVLAWCAEGSGKDVLLETARRRGVACVTTGEADKRNTLQTAARSQAVALENLTASESQIRDADFAAETAALTRSQILVSAGTSTLAIANSTAQSVLALLQ